MSVPSFSSPILPPAVPFALGPALALRVDPCRLLFIRAAKGEKKTRANAREEFLLVFGKFDEEENPSK